MDKRLINFVNKQTGVEHLHIIDMSAEEKSDRCLVFVSSFDYEDQQRYVKRIKSNKSVWYMNEISYDEYCYWVTHSQFEMFKKMNKIMGSTSGLDMEGMIEDAMHRLKKCQAIDEEMEKLPEEDLIDEDAFRKMMGD